MNRNIFLILIILLLVFTSGYSQSWQWERVAGNPQGMEYGGKISRDPHGNLIVAGGFKDSIRFGSYVLKTSAGNDNYVARYDSMGNFKWAKSIGLLAEYAPQKIECDKDGNIFMMATYTSERYLLKFDSNGNFLWNKRFCVTTCTHFSDSVINAYINSFTLDHSGNIIIIGTTYITYNEGTSYLAMTLGGLKIKSNYSNYGYIYKLTNDGSTALYGVDVPATNVADITLDKYDNIYLYTKNYIYKYNSIGQYINIIAPGLNSLGSIFIDGSQNIYCTNPSEFSKLDSLGNLIWKNNYGGFSYGGQAVDVDKYGNFYLTGRFGGTATLGSFQLHTTGQNLFIAKGDKDGNVLWAKSSGSETGDVGLDIISDEHGNAFVTGSYFNNAIFDNDTLKSSGNADMFLAKIGCVPYLPGAVIGDTLVCVGDHPYSVPFVQGASYTWSISGGGTLTSSNNNTTIHWNQEGIYTISVTPLNQCGNGKSKTLKVRVKDIPKTPVLSGDTLVCLGSSTYSVKNIPEVTYTWGLSGGGAISPITNTSVVNWISTGSYTLSVTPSNTCGVGPQLKTKIIVDKIPDQLSAISGNTDVCLGNQLYSVNAVPRTSYNWSLSSGGTINAINNLNNINWTSSGIHSVSVYPYNHCGVGQVQILNVNVKDVPAQPASLTGNSPVCLGSQSYSTVEIPGVSYTWGLSGGGSIASLKGTANVNFVQAGTFVVTVTPSNSCGIGPKRTKTIQVIDIPAQPDSIIGLKNVCLGNQTYVVPPVNGVNYSWSLSGGGTPVPNGNTDLVNWTSPGSYSITVSPFNTCGYGASTSLIVTVNNVSSKISKITGKDKTCLVSEVYNVPFISGFTYNWSLSSGGILTSANNSANVTWASPGIYSLTVTTSDGCSNTLPVTVNDIPKQPNPIEGDSSVCFGNSTYSVAPVNGVNYAWTLSGGGSIASLATTASVDWVNTGSYNVSVTPSNYCGTGQATSLNVQVNDKPSQPSTIIGLARTCLDSATYKAPSMKGVTYTWSLNDGGLMIPSADSAKVYWKKTGQFKLGLTASNQCGTSPTSAKTITVIDKPSKPILTSDSSSCLELKTYKIINIDTINTYLWNLPSGGDLISYNDSATVNWKTAGNYSLTVVPTNMCGSGSSASLSLKVMDIPPTISTIIGDTITCKTLKTYLVPASPGVNYSWNLSGGGYINSTGNNSNINWINEGIYSLTVNPTNRCGIGNSTSMKVYVISTPAQPGLIIGSDSSCIGKYPYSVDSVSGVKYLWTLSGTGGIQSTMNSNKINVDWSNKGSYALNVIPSNQCGSGPARLMNIWVEDIPSVGNINGDNTICNGVLNLFNVSASNDVEYSWTYTGAGIIQANGDSLQLTPSLVGSYLLSVTPSNYCGSGISKSLNVTVNDKPDLNTSITGDILACTKNQSIYSTPSQNHTTYQWSVFPNGGILNNLNEIATVDWAIPGNYKISLNLNNECGNSSTSSLMVQVMELPLRPTIKQSKDTLQSSITGKNRWYLNGSLLPLDTTERIIIKEPGEYYVQAVNYCGTGPVSDVYYFLDPSNYYGFPVIPNPASTDVTVKIPKFLKWKQIELLDELGRVIMKADNNNTNEAFFHIENLPSGLYYFKVETELGIYNEKFVKI